MKALMIFMFLAIRTYAASPGQVCQKISNSITKNDCLAVINQNQFFDQNAVNVCDQGAGSNGFTIVDCMKAIAGKAYNAEVANGCINSNGLVTISCLKQNGHVYSGERVTNVQVGRPAPLSAQSVPRLSNNVDSLNMSISINMSGDMSPAMMEVVALAGTSCDPNNFKFGLEQLGRSADQNRRSLAGNVTVVSAYIASLEAKLVLTGGSLDQAASRAFWNSYRALDSSSFSHYPFETEMTLLNTVKNTRGYILLLESILETNSKVKAAKRAQFENICRLGTE